MTRFVFISFLFFVSGKVFCQDSTGIVTIYVTDGDKTEHLSDYSVKITSPYSTFSAHLKYFVDYSMEGIEPGTYTVRVEKKGYHIAEMTNVPVKAGCIIGLAFKLKKRKFGEKKRIFSEERRELIVDPENK